MLDKYLYLICNPLKIRTLLSLFIYYYYFRLLMHLDRVPYPYYIIK